MFDGHHVRREHRGAAFHAPPCVLDRLPCTFHVEGDGDGGAVHGRTGCRLGQKLPVLAVSPSSVVGPVVVVPSSDSSSGVGDGGFEHLHGSAGAGLGEGGKCATPGRYSLRLLIGRKQHVGGVLDCEHPGERLAMGVVHHDTARRRVVVKAEGGSVAGKGKRPGRAELAGLGSKLGLAGYLPDGVVPCRRCPLDGGLATDGHEGRSHERRPQQGRDNKADAAGDHEAEDHDHDGYGQGDRSGEREPEDHAAGRSSAEADHGWSGRWGGSGHGSSPFRMASSTGVVRASARGGRAEEEM